MGGDLLQLPIKKPTFYHPNNILPLSPFFSSLLFGDWGMEIGMASVAQNIPTIGKRKSAKKGEKSKPGVSCASPASMAPCKGA